MILSYNMLPALPAPIKEAIINGVIALYVQPDGFDDKGTKYLMVMQDLVFRLNKHGELIFPPLEKMPENADKSNIVELKRD